MMAVRLAANPRSGSALVLLWDHIVAGDPFVTGGAMRADFGAFDTGRLSPEWAKRYRADEPRYTVMSYATPIAWQSGAGEWVVPDVKFSQTTTGHQRRVRSALTRAGIEYREGL